MTDMGLEILKDSLMMIVDDNDKSNKEILKDSLMMIVDDDDKSNKEILKNSLLFFHISRLLRFPLVYERIPMCIV